MKTDYLRTVEPFDTLPVEELERVGREATQVGVRRGQTFFEEGQGDDWVFVLATGRVRIQHLRPDGSARTVCLVGPGETYCCLPALDGGPYPATAVAAVDSTALRLPGPTFRDLLARHPEFSARALRHFCGRLREAGCEGCTHGDDAGSRVAAKVLFAAERFPDWLPLTRQEVADLAGTTVETAIRTLKEFERMGWVELGWGKMRIVNRAALERRASGARPVPSARLRVLKRVKKSSSG